MVQSAPTVSLETYHGSSPRQIPALSSYVSPTKAIQDELRRCLATVIQQPLEVITNRCITLYIEHLFPVAPIIHEHSMRSFAPLLELRFEFESSSLQLSSARYREKLSHIRNWTLLTALCAATAFLLPSSLFPERDLLGQHFLRASRDMLRNYQDIDIEQPEYSSLAVRYYHSNALHAVGKTMVSWHVLGEAVRLSQEMRLYDEQSYRDIDPLEAHLRRSIFWQIYTADKSAAILNDCPVALHEICLGIPLTVSYPGPPDQYLRPTLLSASAGYTESHVVTGFNLCQDLWARASGLLVKLDALMILQHSIESPTVSEHFREIVARDHLQFISTLDNLRSDVTPVTPATVESECAATQIDRAKDVQRTNLLVTFHCLRLVILQKFVKNGLSSLLGISEDPLALALRKTEIASDMIRTLSESPFESLQINGEPCVSQPTSFSFDVPLILTTGREDPSSWRYAARDCARSQQPSPRRTRKVSLYNTS